MINFGANMQRLRVPRYIQWIIITGVVFLLLMSLLRLGLVLAFNHPPLASVIPSFLLGFRFDLRIISLFLMIIFLIGSLPPFHPVQKKAGMAVAFALWSVFILLFCFFYIIDFAHYAYLSQRLNASALNYLEDASISAKMVWQSYPVLWILAVLIGGFLLLLGIVRLAYNHVLSRKITSTSKSRWGWSIALFLLLAIGIFGRVGQFPLRWSDAFAIGNDYKAQVSLNPFQSFFSSLNYRHATFDIKKVKEYYPWMAAHLGVSDPDSSKLNFTRTVSTAPLTQPMNVVLVICESFSAYKSSMAGNPLNTTPFFNSLVKDGVYFDNCFSPAYGTARGVWATLTGTPDVQLSNTSSRNPAAVDQHIIINDFKDYEKLYFLGGSASWANIRGVLTNNIPNLQLYEEGSYKAAKIDVWGISDKNLFLESNKILSQQQRPFFAVIQTADNHRPYTIPQEDKGKFNVRKLRVDTLHKYGFSSQAEYEAFVYTDYGFQQFMQAAGKESYYNNTLFVFVGDHGITGDAANLLPRAFTDQTLTPHHVPLLFYAPGKLPAARLPYAASQVDVLPTIAGICKVPYTNTTLGKDLLQSRNDQHAAFIINIDSRRIGVIAKDLFYSSHINGTAPSIASIKNNERVELTDSLHNYFKRATNAYYETARYLLLNNRKQ
jgi:phosphoglycerol transferase MdoB-like AlkP superfamily enzyme